MDQKRVLKRINFLNRYSKPFKEHWFIMIKPMTQDSVVNTVKRLITDYGLEIKAILTHELNSSEADYGFNTKPEYYRDYLCSSPVRCIIVYGENAAQKCLVIKEYIRLMYDVDYQTHKNYVHVPENGFEYKLQKDIFFPDYQSKGYSDLYINWQPGILNNISNMSGKISWVGIVTNPSSYVSFIDELLKYQKDSIDDIGILPAIKFEYGDYSCIKFLSPWLVDDLYSDLSISKNELIDERNCDGEGTNIIEITRQYAMNEQVSMIDKYTSDKLFGGLKSMGPNMKLKTTEEYTNICFEKKLFEWGGSEEVSKLGDYIMPQFKFNKFINSFKNV